MSQREHFVPKVVDQVRVLRQNQLFRLANRRELTQHQPTSSLYVTYFVQMLQADIFRGVGPRQLHVLRHLRGFYQ